MVSPGLEDCVAVHGDSIDAVRASGNNEYRVGSVGPPGKLIDDAVAQQASERSRRALRRSADSGTLRSEMWSSRA